MNPKGFCYFSVLELITDNQEDLQTIKLQEEIIKLQEQLTLAKSEMEILQKDYNTKQVSPKPDLFLFSVFHCSLLSYNDTNK